MAPVEHSFGGAWTEVKLDVLSDYLGFYTNALSTKPFKLWYVDAFAGSGERTVEREVGGILDGRPLSTVKVQLAGSAIRALEIKKPFSRYIFIEKDQKRFAALCELKRDNPNQYINPVNGDANVELPKLFSAQPWSTQAPGTGLHRALVFLDPYSMTVEWGTLEALSKTGAVDLWYLFPTGAVTRQLANSFDAIDAAKAAALDRIFGTAQWRSAFYSTPKETQASFDFDDTVGKPTRHADQAQIEEYVQERLSSLFPFVANCLPLLTSKGAKLFSLYFACSNPSPTARTLAKKGVDYIIKKYR